MKYHFKLILSYKYHIFPSFVRINQAFGMHKERMTFFERDKINSRRLQIKFPPCDVLKSAVKGFMIIKCNESIQLEILPATSVSINYIINGNIMMDRGDGVEIELPKAAAFGITRKAQRFTFADRTTLLVTILKEGCAASVIKSPINHLSEGFMDLNELFCETAIQGLHHKMKEQDSYGSMVRAMERFILSEINFKSIDSMIADALNEIHEKSGQVSIQSLTKELYVSKDAFEKKFRRLVGTTPKHYANIVRFRKLIHKPHSHQKLTTIGLDAGYSDQSHFIKDFKVFTGKAPSKFF